MPDMVPADSDLGRIGGPYSYRVRTVPFSSHFTAGQLLINRSGLLMGLSATFTGADQVSFYDGPISTTGGILSVHGNAGESKEPWFGPQGIYVQTQLSVITSSGGTLIALYWVDLYD